MSADGDALLRAIEAGDVQKLELLLKPTPKSNKGGKGLDRPRPDPRDPSRRVPPLHLAVRAGCSRAVELLVEAGADVNGTDSEGATALMWAAEDRGSCGGEAARQLVVCLTSKGADVNKANAKGRTPLAAAATFGDLGVVDAVLEGGADAGIGSPALEAAAAGHSAVLQRLEEKGARMDATDAEGRTVLMLLIIGGHTGAATSLIRGRDPSGLGLELKYRQAGLTALMVACGAQPPDVDLVEALVGAGASPDAQDDSGNSAIIRVMKEGAWKLANTLIQHSNKVDLKNTANETALSLALEANKEDAVELLFSKKADCGARAADILKSSIEKKQDGVVAQLVSVVKPKVLMDLGVDFRSLVDAGLGKAPVAYIQRFEEEEGPLDDTPLDDAGNTHLHNVAAGGGAGSLAAELVKKGLDPNKGNKNGDTPLHVAAKAGNVDVCVALVESGADPLARNSKNRTPRGQVKVPQATKDYLLDAEDAAKYKKKAKDSLLWDDKMKATQTESAFGVRAL